jgi:MraZ protein
MFRGITALSLDAKGRMAIPSRYRERLLADGVEQLILTLDHRGQCLLLYPLPVWEAIERELISAPNLLAVVDQLKHTLIGHATECEPDAQGRILLPGMLRELVGIDRQVALVGLGNKFELWDEAAWSERRKDWLRAAQDGAVQLPEQLSRLAF